MKVVINVSYGKFGLSRQAYERLIELGIPVRTYTGEVSSYGSDGFDHPEYGNAPFVYDNASLADKDNFIRKKYWDSCFIEGHRHHPLLIQVVEELGNEANGSFADLKIIKIPDDVEYVIFDYDGIESVHEKHRMWTYSETN